jgi:hypothetical protein
MDISLVMDQLLENTTLLANLGDAEANYLLGWTRRALPSLIGEISDETLGWRKVEALKETLRAANALIARYRTASEQTFLALLRAFCGNTRRPSNAMTLPSILLCLSWLRSCALSLITYPRCAHCSTSLRTCVRPTPMMSR